jgi:molecular chaperone HtpG
MDKEQDKIYYITAQSYNAAKNSPHLEYFRKKGIEVLLLVDRVDEWLVSHLNEFNGKNLQSITKGKLDLPEETDKKKEKEDKKNYASMIKQIKEILGSKVKDVEITYRLTDSPACIVADQDDMGLEMQRIMQAAGQSTPESKPIFEINPSHHLIQKLNDETDDNIFAQWTKVLFEQSILSEGGSLEDPAAFVNNLNRLLGNLAK